MPAQVHDCAYKRFAGLHRDSSFRGVKRTTPQDEEHQDQHQQQHTQKKSCLKRKIMGASTSTATTTTATAATTTTATATRKQKRSIRFCHTVLIMVTTSRYEYTEEEKENAFYSKKELQAIQHHAATCAKKVVYDSRKPTPNSTGKRICARGLEHTIQQIECMLDRVQFPQLGRQEVLEVLQMQAQTKDPEVLGRIASRHSQPCQESAHRMGLRDERIAAKL